MGLCASDLVHSNRFSLDSLCSPHTLKIKHTESVINGPTYHFHISGFLSVWQLVGVCLISKNLTVQVYMCLAAYSFWLTLLLLILLLLGVSYDVFGLNWNYQKEAIYTD